METPGDFADWACAPERSLEERFGAEFIIESTRMIWNRKHDIQEMPNYEADRLRRKARGLDPAYEPRYTRKDALRAQEVLADVTTIHSSYSDDRPLRDISFVRFCPAIDSVSTSQSEITDWSPLRFLPKLTKLHIFDRTARDLTVLGDLPGLESIHLWLWKPWPDLSGMERLTKLRRFDFSGNILALPVIPRLEGVVSAKFTHTHNFNVPVRSVADLPAMPGLRTLHLDNTTELDGIERYPHLLNLTIFGYYSDLAPLATLQELTHLFLSGGDYPSLIPVSRMAALRKVTLRLEFPPDLTPLADLPLLHEIALEHSPIVPAELASLNSLCNPWEDEFAVTPMRPLLPLRLLVRNREETTEKADSTAEPRDWGDDEEMARSEARWFTRRINRLLDKLLGKGWGHESELYASGPGYQNITITRPEDIDRLPQIATALRKVMLGARHPWRLLLIVDSLARFERDLDEIQNQDDDEEFNAEREREEWEYAREQRRERKEFLQRKYRLLLSQETGIPVPPPDPASPPPPKESGNLAEAGEEEDDDPGYDLGTKLHLYATLTEKAVYVNERDRCLAEMLFEMKME